MLPIAAEMAPPTTVEIIDFNRQLRSLAARKHCTFIDLYPLFVGPRGDLDAAYSQDGVHLNGPAYLRWKTAVEKHVK
jgi:lysophospholipase L1-like esterase